MNKLPTKNQQGFVLPLIIAITLLLVLTASFLYVRNKFYAKQELINSISLASAEVVITKDGFIPSTISIIAGGQITFVNEDKNIHGVIPYPINQKNNLLLLDSINLQPSDSITYSFEKTGTFTLSDIINPGKHIATIIVN